MTTTESLITAELSTRNARAPDYQAEARALRELAHALATPYLFRVKEQAPAPL
ncbi:hypothetical protein [Paraburkholderia fungorum]|uniref:hypothetical protein n=1 Tax=Paraburkholderia fungorum TaxID=134537 RepID=UPI0038B6D8AF